jgi:hypothetical protein
VIRREEGGFWFLISQPQHARLSGEMAARWGGRASPHEELIFAASRHDTGWEEWELFPTLHPPSGAPAHFLEVPASVNMDIWRRGIDRLLREGRPYAALLVSHHASAIYRRGVTSSKDSKRHGREVGLFLREEEERQADLMRRLAVDERYGPLLKRVWLDLRLLQVWDLLSLMVCSPWTFLEVIPDVPWPDLEGERAPEGVGPLQDMVVRWQDGGAIGLRPYPFIEAPVQFGVEARRLPARPLPSDQALQEALALSSRENLTFTFCPA